MVTCFFLSNTAIAQDMSDTMQVGIQGKTFSHKHLREENFSLGLGQDPLWPDVKKMKETGYLKAWVQLNFQEWGYIYSFLSDFDALAGMTKKIRNSVPYLRDIDPNFEKYAYRLQLSYHKETFHKNL